MFLYEVGLRSTDLVDQARRLGIDGALATTELSRHQVVFLRNALVKGQAQPQAQSSGPDPSCTSPLVLQTGPNADPGPQPLMPPPAAPEAPPAATRPAPPAPPPRLAPPPPPRPEGVGSPAPPPPGPSHGASPLPQSGPVGIGGSPTPAGDTGPASWRPSPAGAPTFEPFAAPVTGSRAPWDGAATAAPAGGPLSAASPSDGSRDGARGFKRGQVLILGVVVALTVALFAFMALNSGPDTERARALAEANRRAEQLPASTLAPPPTTTTAATTTSAAGEQPGPQYLFADQEQYCRGALDIAPFELRVVAGAIERDWQQVRKDALGGRAAWRQGVDAMILGGPADLQGDLLVHRDAYDQLIDRLAASQSEPEALEAFRRIPLGELREAGNRINAATRRTCR